MKKISVLLAVIMIFSCVTVCAAPVADYVFYDEDAGSYFVYGRYLNSTASGRNLHATEAGVYVNGEKFVYGGEDAYVTEEGEDGPVDVSYLELANRMDVPKFAIQFKAPKDYFDGFKVQPYIVNKTGEIKGDAINYDVATGERILSDNADLKYINVEMANRGKHRFMMYPQFDPDTLDYTVEGYFTAAAPLAGSELTYGLADSRATAAVTHEGTTSYITVTAEDGSTKTYSVTYVRDGYMDTTDCKNPTAIASAYYQGTLNTTNTQPLKANGQIDLQYYPASGDTRIFLMTFDIDEAMKTKEHFAITFIPYMSLESIFTDYVLSAKKLTVADGYELSFDKTCYQDVVDGKLTIGEEVGRTTVKSMTYKTWERFSVDVTKAVKDAIAEGKSSFGVTLSIDSCTVPAGELNPTSVIFRTYVKNSTPQYNLQLVY